MRGVLTLTAVVAASAQYPSQGMFEHIQPNLNEQGNNPYPGCLPTPNGDPSCTGPIPLWHQGATWNGGGFYVGGTDSSLSRSAHVWGFDVTTEIWRPFTSALPGFAADDLVTFGGYVVAVGGANTSSAGMLAALDTTMGTNGPAWGTVPVVGVADPHMGHRLVEYGGFLYMMGGLVNITNRGWVWSNHMWAINLDAATTAITSGQPQSWVLLQNRSTAGWSGRAGFTLVRYGGDILLYGGYNYDLTQLFPPQDPLTVCLNPLANCNVYTDIWEYRPGILANGLTPCPAATGCNWFLRAPHTSAQPPPRFFHAAAVISDDMYIYGGTNGQGAWLTDLWVYRLVTGQWTQVQSVNQNFNAFPVQKWGPSMAAIGRHLYIEQTGDDGGNALYRWTPSLPPPPSGGGGAPAPAPASNNPPAGTTAGIVIAILVALANTTLLVLLALKAGALPFVGGGVRKQAADVSGFYSSSPAAPADLAGAYVAPANI